MAEQLIFTHFTDTAGVEGITGLEDQDLMVGTIVEVDRIYFGFGENGYMTDKAGRIFLTEHGFSVSSIRLSLIGIAIPKQKFGIRFSAQTLHENGIEYVCEWAERSIYTIPGNVTINGLIQVLKRF